MWRTQSVSEEYRKMSRQTQIAPAAHIGRRLQLRHKLSAAVAIVFFPFLEHWGLDEMMPLVWQRRSRVVFFPNLVARYYKEGENAMRT